MPPAGALNDENLCYLTVGCGAAWLAEGWVAGHTLFGAAKPDHEFGPDGLANLDPSGFA